MSALDDRGRRTVADVAEARARLLGSAHAQRRRIAVLAPPWITVPPHGYGGIEAVVELLCEQLVAQGHDVTLLAAPGSRSVCHVETFTDMPHPDKIGASVYESDHVASAWEYVERGGYEGRPFEVVHDHSGFTALAMADRVRVPVVHTIHGPFDSESARFYQRHGHKATLVALSRSQAESAPPGVRIAAVVPNPIAIGRWPLVTAKHDYLLWMGRMDPVKGAHRAIAAARIAGRRLVLAGPIQPGQENYFKSRIEPHLDGVQVRYAGSVAGTTRQSLFANAAGFLMPVRWREPFGMVMIEALACGTPVIAFPEGAAAEIVTDGENGWLVQHESEMADAIGRLSELDPLQCRESVATRYSMERTVGQYEQVYRQVAGSALTANTPTSRAVDLAGVAARELMAER